MVQLTHDPEVLTKACVQCSTTLPIAAFKLSAGKYRMCRCRDCFNTKQRECRPPLKPEAKIRQRLYKQAYDLANVGRISEYGRKVYQNKKDNPSYKARNREYILRRLNEVPAVRVAHNCRIRIRKLLQRSAPRGRFNRLLGANALQIVFHLTNGTGIFPRGYHLDHYIPVSHFDLTNEFEQMVCFNWRNLRLIPAWENLSKCDRLPFDYRERELVIREALSLDGASL